MVIGLKSAAIAGLVLANSGPLVFGQEVETRGGYCNDNYFNSDGGGISGCMEYALHYDSQTLGIGLFGVTPELKGGRNSDPLSEISRISAWYGQEFETDGLHYSLTGRAGVEGGVADDLALALQSGIHDAVGVGGKGLRSTHDSQVIGGVSGWVRRDYAMPEIGTWGAVLTPYAHGTLGNDSIEAGVGVMLALQPASETEGLALLMPKTGAYAPAFGGDGIAVFAGVRGVARESLYGDRVNPFIAEAGITGQVTLWNFAVFGASASCTNTAYDGAPQADCKATLQLGGLF